MKTVRSNFLKEYLNWFWLRPETAVLLALRAEKYAKSLELFDDKSIDVSCGDGVFSFIAAGGRLCQSADMYQSLNLSEKRIGNFDVYDHYDESYKLKVVKGANFKYEFGSDWKPNLLQKAGKLTYYRNLIVHDNNKPFDFHEGRFNYVYSNAAYWVNKFEAHLRDLVRITNQGGHIVLEMKTTDIQSVSAKNYLQPVMGSKFCDIIDAGRMETWLGLPTLSALESLLDKLGNVEVVEKSPLYGDTVAYIWDIGLRPLFRPLAKMASNLDSGDRSSIKTEWCEIIFEMMEHFVNNYEASDETAIEWIYVLKKTS